jgi:hypothetical protein
VSAGQTEEAKEEHHPAVCVKNCKHGSQANDWRRLTTFNQAHTDSDDLMPASVSIRLDRNDVTNDKRKLHSGELQNSSSSQNIIRTMDM